MTTGRRAGAGRTVVTPQTLVGLARVARMSVRLPYCGREAEMVTLSDQLDRVRAGLGTVSWLRGMPGWGRVDSYKKQRWRRTATAFEWGAARLIPATALSSLQPSWRRCSKE
jgi:hypothetical protein